MATTQLLKTALFANGLDAYWEQFTSLKERLESYIPQLVIDANKDVKLEQNPGW